MTNLRSSVLILGRSAKSAEGEGRPHDYGTFTIIHMTIVYVVLAKSSRQLLVYSLSGSKKKKERKKKKKKKKKALLTAAQATQA